MVNHHKTDKSPPWHGACGAGAEAPVTSPGRSAAGARGPRATRPRHRIPRSRAGSLNWSLRRYVLASSLRVWLRRRPGGEGRPDTPAGRGGRLGARARRPGTVGGTRSPLLRERGSGGSRASGSVLGYRASRNRQMEHLAQPAVSLRGGVRRGSAIAARESVDAGGLILTTLSSDSCV